MNKVAILIKEITKKIRKMVILYNINTGKYNGYKYLTMTEKLLTNNY
jgi:hypothetical protein